MDGTVSFGQWLKQHRKQFDLTQEELAERIGCSVVAISKIEVGVRRPSRQMAELLADLFKIPAEERETFIAFARGLDAQAGTPGTISGHRPPGNLPAALTPLIGRDEEIIALTDLLTLAGTRLLTLTGPPGIGKTRLSIEVASDLVEQFEGGVFFVGLATVKDVDAVVPTIATALELSDAAGQSRRQTLLDYVRAKRMLLVLDNFEQVLDAGNEVVALLEGSPRLKVLVTSREALHVPGEHQFHVPPLQIADPASMPPVQILQTIPAVTLFIERARAVKPSFALTEQNANAVAAICARLQGLPLAIELAAARVNLLSPHEIQLRLDDSLTLLESAARHLPPKQRTLRGAIDWSYHLLNEDEKALFARLGVFVGGCTLASAEAVCNAGGDIVTGAMEGLASLVNKSLLHREEDAQGGSRFIMLETIREYALTKLYRRGEAEVLRRQHALYFMRFAEEAEPKLDGAQQTVWMDRLEEELNNIRTALSWAQASGETELGLRLAGTLYFFWFTHSYLAEGRERLAAALFGQGGGHMDMQSIPRTTAAAKALYGLGRLTGHLGDYSLAYALLERGIEISREIGDKKWTAHLLSDLSMLAKDKGDNVTARRLGEESVVIATEIGDRPILALALRVLGIATHNLGENALARSYLEQALAMHKELGNKRGGAHALNLLGEVARSEGDYERAERMYSESLAAFREVGHKPLIAVVGGNLAHVLLHRGDLQRAEAMFIESIELSKELSFKWDALLLEGVARVAVIRDPSEEGGKRGARLLGAMEAVMEGIGADLAAADRLEFDHTVELVRALLDEAVFEAARIEGHAMSMEQAIDYALELSHETNR